MDERLEQFRAGAVAVGSRRRGRKFPKELIALGAAYVREQRQAGASWQTLSAALDVGVPTLQRWVSSPPAAAATFHSVSVAEAQPRGRYSAVLGGLRIEGLELDAVIALARSLS